jgi:hypothetical protein
LPFFFDCEPKVRFDFAVHFLHEFEYNAIKAQIKIRTSPGVLIIFLGVSLFNFIKSLGAKANFERILVFSMNCGIILLCGLHAAHGHFLFSRGGGTPSVLFYGYRMGRNTMKNLTRTIFFTALFALMLLMGSCADLFNPPEAPRPAAGKGRLAIMLEDGSRTALPSGGFDKYILRFRYDGEDGYTHDDFEWTSGDSVELEPGVWTIYADAYTGGVVSGTGSAEVTVNAGLTTPVRIRITIKTGGTPGTLKYTVSYPPAGANHAYGTQTLTVSDVSGAAAPGSPKNISNGAVGSIQLSPGVYIVTAIINDTIQRTQALRTAAAHIYAGQETVLTISIGEGEFTAAIPLTGTADIGGSGVPGGGSRVIRAYSEAGCAGTSLLGDSGELDSGGHFTLWIPSRDIPQGGTVYLRQEITVNGVTTTGTVRSVTIPENQDEPLAINWGAGLDLLYSVTVASGISNGTVSPSFDSAFPGTLVTLTVTPEHEAAALKPGTLQVNGGVIALAG